ncbi:MAG: hypothetical protein Q9169_003076 [Polycauliona sp. 2 TL-2023]
MPLWNFQSLWHDETDNSIWAFAGEISFLASSDPDFNIWNFKLNGGGGGTWTQKTNGRRNPLTSDLTDFVPTPGLLSYSFHDGLWANITDTPHISDSGAIEWAGMEYVPFGPQGLMVVIGGETSDLTVYRPGSRGRSMTQITVFDPLTLRFYMQTATGDRIPSERMRFCIAGVGDSSKIGDASRTSESISSSSDQTAAVTPSPSSRATLSRNKRIGLSVGSSIGALVLLLLATLIFFHIRRRPPLSDKNPSHPNPPHRTELATHDIKHELATHGVGKYELPPTVSRKPASPRFVVELDAGQVAMEKGARGVDFDGFEAADAA